jgi:hypothetical protein
MRMKMKARKLNKNKQQSKTQLYKNNKLSNYMFLPSRCTVTLEPEPTQHSKPTFVWIYIAGTSGYI